MKQVVQREAKKQPTPRAHDAIQFDAFWNNKSGKFDNAADYVFSFREKRGWFRGASTQRKYS